MKTQFLDVVEDRATGDLGLIARGVRLMDYPMVAAGSFAGRLIAHDITEHMNGLKNIGSVDDELEAFGAILYGRCQTGHLEPLNLAYDICELARCYITGVNYRTSIPRTNKLDEEYECDLVAMVHEGVIMAHDELGDEDFDVSRAGEFKSTAIHYLRRGFRKAHRKYSDPCVLTQRFEGIQSAVDRIANEIEYEGQSFRLTIKDNRHFHCEEVYKYEY